MRARVHMRCLSRWCKIQLSYWRTGHLHKNFTLYFISFLIFSFYSCSTSKSSIVNKKYAAKKLKEDYRIFQGALEESHPGLYWFTPKPEIDKVFAEGYSSIKDSMTERQFRTLLLKVVTPIRCGHTSVSYS